MFAEIDMDLRDENPPRRLKDLQMKAGSDNGAEKQGPDIQRIMTKYGVTHEFDQNVPWRVLEKRGTGARKKWLIQW
eukprot:COSAG01_NODE_31011_length_605_cov_1.308300_1_plen_76_part_00